MLINICAQKMLEFINKTGVQFRYKDQIGSALEYLIQKDSNNVIVYAVIANMMDMLEKIKMENVENINFQFVSLISEALADKIVPATGQQADRYIYQSFLALARLTTQILEYSATQNKDLTIV